jgi:preprotein translocase subunit SecA
LKIEHCDKGTVEEAQIIASAWQANFGDDLGELEWRYAKVKEIARRSYPPVHAVASRIQSPRRPTLAAIRPDPGRNDPCPCGSGKKYKKCCGR